MNNKSKKEIERKRPVYYINDEVASPEYTLTIMYETYKSYPKSRLRYEKIWPLEDVEIIKQRFTESKRVSDRKKNYRKYINSKEWKLKRDAIVEKYKKCSCCGSEENLNVHHLTYENLGNENESDLLLLCKDCHKFVHKGKIKIFYMNAVQIKAFNKIKDILIENFRNDFYGYVIIKTT
jgi:5-methylcytosine-specific restriction endonuclease McrA